MDQYREAGLSEVIRLSFGCYARDGYPSFQFARSATLVAVVLLARYNGETAVNRASGRIT